MFARLTEGGGQKLFGQCPYGNNTFQKGASLGCVISSFVLMQLLNYPVCSCVYNDRKTCIERLMNFFIPLIGDRIQENILI